MNKSIWMSTSHKIDANNMLATHYANDLKGGESQVAALANLIEQSCYALSLQLI
jgi:hypothetical protein